MRWTMLLTFLLFILTGCSWAVNLVIANLSDVSIEIGYLIPPEDSSSQFHRDPKTYAFDSELNKINKKKNGLIELQTQSSFDETTRMLVITIPPRSAVHIGHYYSFQDPELIYQKYNLTIWPGKATVSRFRHWENINTDLMEVK